MIGCDYGKAVTHFNIEPNKEELLEYLDSLASTYDEPEKFKNYLNNETHMPTQLVLVEKKVVESVMIRQ